MGLENRQLLQIVLIAYAPADDRAGIRAGLQDQKDGGVHALTMTQGSPPLLRKRCGMRLSNR